jgi:hypothetical protein
MITINLAPWELIRDHYWYVKDLLVLFLAIALVSVGALYYEQEEQNQIKKIQFVIDTWNTDIQNMSHDVQAFRSLKESLSHLQKQKEAVQYLTHQQKELYEPIILLEHIQNLMPEGVWISEFIQDSQKKEIRMKGFAWDHIKIANLMKTLASTQTQTRDPVNLRSLIFFQNLKLEETKIMNQNDPAFIMLLNYERAEL